MEDKFRMFLKEANVGPQCIPVGLLHALQVADSAVFITSCAAGTNGLDSSVDTGRGANDVDIQF